jgi:hypothetical protein
VPLADSRVVDTREQSEFFVLAYDSATISVRSFTGHGHDFVGAVLTLTAKVDQHRADPHVVVRIYEASSFGELPDRCPNPFWDLHFPNGS